MTRRGGFTVVEIVVAAAIGSLVIAALFGALTHVSRGWRRADLALVRTQVAERLLERLTDDVAHLDGWQQAVAPADGLKAVGYDGEQKTFLERPRDGAHILNAYHVGAVRPHLSELIPYHEQCELTGRPNPLWVTDLRRCRYLHHDPRPAYNIQPMGALPSVFAVRAGDEVTYLAMALGRGMKPQQVVWSFRRSGSDTGRVRRWSSDQGLFEMTERTLLSGEVWLRNQYLHVTTPSGQKGSEVFEVLVEVELRAPENPNTPGPDPGFVCRRIITAGM